MEINSPTLRNVILEFSAVQHGQISVGFDAFFHQSPSQIYISSREIHQPLCATDQYQEPQRDRYI